MNRVTSGPVVNESLETNIEGVFACGNVLHVHDLVDFVSEEAAAAGKNAARYVKDGRRSGTGQEIELSAVEGYAIRCPAPSIRTAWRIPKSYVSVLEMFIKTAISAYTLMVSR